MQTRQLLVLSAIGKKGNKDIRKDELKENLRNKMMAIMVTN